MVRSKTFMSGKSAPSGIMHSKSADEESRPVMFSYSTPDPIRSRVQISGDKGISWCKPLSLDAVGSSFSISIPFPNNGAQIVLGVSIKEGEEKVRVSKSYRVVFPFKNYYSYSSYRHSEPFAGITFLPTQIFRKFISYKAAG